MLKFFKNIFESLTFLSIEGFNILNDISKRFKVLINKGSLDFYCKQMRDLLKKLLHMQKDQGEIESREVGSDVITRQPR